MAKLWKILSVSRRKPKKLKGKTFVWIFNRKIGRWVKFRTR